MDSTKFIKTLNDLNKITDHESLCDNLNEFCTLSDLPAHLLLIVNDYSFHTPKIKISSNHPRHCISYLKNNIHTYYPLISYLIDTNIPIPCIKSFYDSQNTDDDEDIFTNDKHKLFDGFSTHIKSTTGENFIFIMKPENYTETTEIDNTIPFVHTYTANFVQRYSTIKNEKSKTTLTKRELDCLFWASEGKTSWEISKIIEITERTVLFHLKNSMTKLSACNRQHAVVLAIKKGLLKANLSRAVSVA